MEPRRFSVRLMWGSFLRRQAVPPATDTSPRHILKLGSPSLLRLNVDYNIHCIALFEALLLAHFVSQKINDSGLPVRRGSVFETNCHLAFLYFRPLDDVRNSARFVGFGIEVQCRFGGGRSL